MTPKLIKIRDEKADRLFPLISGSQSHVNETIFSRSLYIQGANFMYEQLAPLIEDLRFYADYSKWDRLVSVNPADAEWDEEDEYGYRQVSGGKRAREALKKIEGE